MRYTFSEKMYHKLWRLRDKFVLKRHFKYQEEGRIQNEEEANLVDEDIRDLIESNNIYIWKEICEDKPEEKILEITEMILNR